MDELTVLLEGIQHKVKRLLIVNNKLNEKIDGLERERQVLLAEIESHKQLNEQMNDAILHLQSAKTFEGKDTLVAKQKVNELLREIDNCYKLIKSQAK